MEEARAHTHTRTVPLLLVVPVPAVVLAGCVYVGVCVDVERIRIMQGNESRRRLKQAAN